MSAVKPKLLKLKKNPKGMPGKSYTHVIELDRLFRIILSPFLSLNIFDLYVASCIKNRRKQKERKKMVTAYINYMACYDSDRIDFILPSTLIQRSQILQFLVEYKNYIKRRKDLLGKDIEDLTTDDIKFLFLINIRIGDNLVFIEKNIEDILEDIKFIYTHIMQNYVTYIIKGLMLRRKGEINPNKLNTDAYNVLVAMLDSYDVLKSRVTFNTYLIFFIKAVKNDIIKRETWNLKVGKLLSLDTILEENTKDNFNNVLPLNLNTVKNNSYSDISNILNILNHTNEYESYDLKEYEFIIDKLLDYLPKPFYDILTSKFEIITPLNIEEELALILNT